FRFSKSHKGATPRLKHAADHRSAMRTKRPQSKPVQMLMHSRKYIAELRKFRNDARRGWLGRHQQTKTKPSSEHDNEIKNIRNDHGRRSGDRTGRHSPGYRRPSRPRRRWRENG